jgi:hypothetical protein
LYSKTWAEQVAERKSPRFDPLDFHASAEVQMDTSTRNGLEPSNGKTNRRRWAQLGVRTPQTLRMGQTGAEKRQSHFRTYQTPPQDRLIAAVSVVQPPPSYDRLLPKRIISGGDKLSSAHPARS